MDANSTAIGSLAAQDEKHVQQTYTWLPSETPDVGEPGPVLADQMLTMRDGVRLAMDVYLPAGARRFATVLTRLPYGKTEPYCFMPVVAAYWVRKGYAAVVQDVRGKWGSEGVFEPNMAANEINDAYDTVEWIATQPWSSGRVGMWGESYFGFTSWAGAVSGHPALGAIAPGDISVDRYKATFRDGCLQLNTVGLWAIRMMAREYQNLSRLNPAHWPLADLGNAAGVPSSYFDSVIANPVPSAFWAERSLLAAYDSVKIPVLHWGGWYDCYLGPTIADWQRIREANAPAGHNHLFIGPWDHEGTPDKTGRAGLVPTAAGTLAHRWDTYRAFFDRYLLGADNGFGDRGAVHYYTLGAGEWRDAEAWPPPGTTTARLYLRGDGSLTGGEPRDDAPRAFDYDPNDPVAWTLDIDCWALAEGMGDRAVIEQRADVLSYTGPVQEAPLELTGPITARLQIASTAVGTDFTVALCDVFPDGRVNLVQDGVLRTPFRAPGAPPLTPGEVYALDIDLWSTSYVVAAGHRLRVEVTSSDFNRYDRNPNTGATFGREARPVVARQTVYSDARWPSYIEVSVAGGA